MSTRYIGPYKIIEKLSLMAYRLDLSVELEHVHIVFHISQLRKACFRFESCHHTWACRVHWKSGIQRASYTSTRLQS